VGGGGAVVNIGSIEGLRPAPAHAPYGASKAALSHLTRAAALDLASDAAAFVSGAELAVDGGVLCGPAF
jgi:NAD(P)-dependent dehydrogenase (short-subunit alcohol dehydrogenase family)